MKNLKSLVLRCQANKEDLRRAIATWRNIAREDGISPSQAFFQRKQRQSWPILAEDLQLAPPDMSRKLDKNIKLRNNRDRHTKKFAQLHIGQRVWMQHHQTKEWYQQATVIAMHSNGQTYTVQSDLGSTYTRGIRLLRPARQQPNRVVKARQIKAHLISRPHTSHTSSISQEIFKMPKALFKTKGVPSILSQQLSGQTLVSPVVDRALDLTLHQVSGDGGASHSSIAPCPTNLEYQERRYTDHSVSTIINQSTVIGHQRVVDTLSTPTVKPGVLPI